MTRKRATQLAWGLWSLELLCLIAAVSLRSANHRHFVIADATQIVGFVAIGGVGAVIASRKPSNALGWLYLAIGVFAASAAGALQDYALYATVTHPGLPGGVVAEWVTQWAWVPPFTLLLTFSFLLFPDGRLPTPRWRPVAWASVIVGVLWSISFMFEQADYSNALDQPAHNPFAIAGLVPFFNTARVVLSFVFLGLVACSIASLAFRYRRVDPDERHQLKWLIFAASILLVWLFLPFNHGSGTWVDAVTGVLITLIPVSAGIAILKYRLYDIDVVISKALVYSALAAFVTLAYLAIVVGIGALVGTRGRSNLLLSVGATAIVALAFQPVLVRVRRVANHLAYGRRATPYEVLAAFSDRVGEAYATDDVLSRMAQVLQTGTGADNATVWLRSGAEMRTVAMAPIDADPTQAVPDDAVEVRYQGESLGALSVRMPANDRLDPAREKLVHDLAAQAGLVLRNVALIEDLKTSRQRLVTAQDERARKLERNIHDGAQQQLVALAVKLKLTDGLVDRDPAQAHEALARLQTDAHEALENLRDLARGIYPPLLADKGLAAALESQARRVSIPVTVEAEGIGRFPQEAEAAIYFSCLEALQNVTKYADASLATVTLTNGAGELRFAVADDGSGFDPQTTSYGTGLQGIADRLAALGGSLQITSAPGAGTTLIGKVPV